MRLRFVVPIVLLLSALSACKKEYITEIHSVARDLVLDSAAVTLYPGQNTRVMPMLSSPLNVSVGESLSWESRSPTTATVASDGTIRAVAPGYTLITVYLMERGVKTSLSAAVQVTVLARPVIPVVPAVVTLSVSTTAVTLIAGDSVQSPAPIVTTTPDTLTKAVIWRSLSPSTATVSSTGLIRGVAPGVATIRVLAVADTTKSATITVTVNARPPAAIFVRSITTNPQSMSLRIGVVDSVTVTVTADPGVPTTYTCASTNAALLRVIQRTDGKCTFSVVAAFSTAVNPPKVVFTTVGRGSTGVSLTAEVTVRYSP